MLDKHALIKIGKFTLGALILLISDPDIFNAQAKRNIGNGLRFILRSILALARLFSPIESLIHLGKETAEYKVVLRDASLRKRVLLAVFLILVYSFVAGMCYLAIWSFFNLSGNQKLQFLGLLVIALVLTRVLPKLINRISDDEQLIRALSFLVKALSFFGLAIDTFA